MAEKKMNYGNGPDEDFLAATHPVVGFFTKTVLMFVKKAHVWLALATYAFGIWWAWESEYYHWELGYYIGIGAATTLAAVQRYSGVVIIPATRYPHLEYYEVGEDY